MPELRIFVLDDGATHWILAADEAAARSIYSGLYGNDADDGVEIRKSFAIDSPEAERCTVRDEHDDTKCTLREECEREMTPHYIACSEH